MNKKQQRMILTVSCLLIFLMSSAPVFCGYVMEGGDAVLWLERIREVKQNLTEGKWSLFSSPDLILVQGSSAEAFDSVLWLLPAAGMQLLGIGEQMAYCLFLGLVEIGTLVSAWWMMGAFTEKRTVALFGTAFYMGCPYHIYICFDKADLGQAVVWALVPALIGGMVRLHNSRNRNVFAGCVAAIAYAGIWYADARWGVITGAGMAFWFVVWERWIWGLLPLVSGGVLAMPIVYYLARYLIKGGMQVLNLPLDSIMKNGYTIGFFLTSWVYRPDVPGIGLGLMGGLLLLAWLYWSGQPDKMSHSVKGVLWMAAILTFVSLKCFPWDYIQRLGLPLMRFVGLLETAGVFWGCANMLLVVPAAWAVGELRKKQGYLWQWGIPVLILMAALATSLYLCNSLTYLRPPLGQELVRTVAY